VKKLWPHQERGLTAIRSEVEGGCRRVLAVAPTGAGKGTMAASMLADAARAGQRCLLLVHRREIVKDIAKRVSAHGVAAGMILPGSPQKPRAKVQVASVQTLALADETPPAELVIVDEAHHYAADEWGAVLARYPAVTMVGFTATPQRGDGRPLGDVFDGLVVVAHYSELIEEGLIVSSAVLRPPAALGKDLAQDPVDAYLRYAPGTPAMLFVRRVREAKRAAERMTEAGHPCGFITAETSTGERDETVAKLKDGRLTAIANVFTMTEGVDVPRVQTIVLARSCQHASTYVQICGRALRAAPGKERALLLDLSGASYAHGMPHDDRVYTLDSRGMGGGSGGREGTGERDMSPGEVLGVELEPVGGGDAAMRAPDPKRERWDELAVEIEAGRLTIAAGVDVYRREFGERPAWVGELSEVAKERERGRMTRVHPRLARLKEQELLG